MRTKGPAFGLRRFGAAVFAWLAEPKLTLGVSSRERRLVDQNSASWNPMISWLRSVEALRKAA
jgi:hypothetical protein